MIKKLNEDYAPIVLFTYNRLNHVIETVQALKRNLLAENSDIYIYSDGPKDNSDIDSVNQVRQYLNSISGFRSITLINSNINKGLASSIILGVSEICNKHGKVIVLEDDLITSPFFLKFMNDALTMYENNQRVISIHGYTYPVNGLLPDIFFLRGADCWGWATWQRGWNLFQNDGNGLLLKIKESGLQHAFNFDGSYDYLGMLDAQVNGKNDSWAIRWHASAFINDKLTLYPGQSLVKNIGFDGSGSHCEATSDYYVEIMNDMPRLDGDVPVEESILAKQLIKIFFKSKKPRILKKVYLKLILLISFFRANN